jgi:putative copper resistance protein D
MTALQTIVGWCDLACTIVFAGGYISAVVIALPSRDGRRAMQWAAGVLAAALVAELAINAVRLAAITEIGGLAFVADMFGTRWCRLWVVRCVGLALLLVLRAGTGHAALVAAAWLALRSFQGHAGAHGTVPAVIDWIHLLAAATWLGSLLQLTLLRGVALPALAARVRRLATLSVAALIPAGVYGALLHIPNIDRLLNSPYGRTLLVKLALTTGLLILGAANHFRYVPALLRYRDRAAEQRLRRSVRWELAIATLVVLMSALLGVLPMPHGMLQ